MINRIVTTKQKRFLEKSFKCLGVNIDEFLEINNLSEYKKQIIELQERIELLEKALIQANDVIGRTSNLVAELIANAQKSAFEQIFNGFGESTDKEVSN